MNVLYPSKRWRAKLWPPVSIRTSSLNSIAQIPIPQKKLSEQVHAGIGIIHHVMGKAEQQEMDAFAGNYATRPESKQTLLNRLTLRQGHTYPPVSFDF